MYYNAVVVLLKDFLTGVLSALIIYAVLYRFLDKSDALLDKVTTQQPAPLEEELHLKEGAA